MSGLAPSLMENWIAGRLQVRGYSPDQLEAFQLDAFNHTLAHVKANSPFYRNRLRNVPDKLDRLEQLSQLPFTTAEDLRRHHLEMLCTSHGDVARVVTLHTSGTAAAPKRLYFSLDDLELTVDFFHHGMASVVRPNQKVLILLPGKTPDSVGDLLRRGLARMSVEGHIHWPLIDLEAVVHKIHDFEIDGLVGAPFQVFALCRLDHGRRFPPGRLKTVLLSTDYIPRAVVAELQRVWRCSVYEHYGMTEMGLGGGLDCDAHEGYHIRELDLLAEIIDPRDGTPLPSGVEGEVVFTTLTRQAMPLIRYRTGDRSSWLKTPCPCGSRLRRLGTVRGRIDALDHDGAGLSMPLLDEALLTLPGVYAFQADRLIRENRETLALTLFCPPDAGGGLKVEAAGVVKNLMAGCSTQSPTFVVRVRPPEALRWDASGMVKRTIGTEATVTP